MTSPWAAARPLLNPLDGVGEAIEGRRWAWPLLLVMACATSSAVAVHLRLDPTARVVTSLGASGELANLTEREVADKIELARRMDLVAGVARGLLWLPLAAVLSAVALKVTAWILGLEIAFARGLTAVSVALLPAGLYALGYALCALRQDAVTDSQLALLLPSSLRALFPHASVKAGRVLAAVDYFNLWSAGLLGLGFAAASGTGRGRGVAVGFGLYGLYAMIFLVALPGMGALP